MKKVMLKMTVRMKRSEDELCVTGNTHENPLVMQEDAIYEQGLVVVDKISPSDFVKNDLL
jgi:hypothetical protein